VAYIIKHFTAVINLIAKQASVSV